ncbi:MAG TPA: glycosyltransferase family 2 protein [Rariglobus sp.]
MSRPHDPLISIIVPCFNEEESLPILFQRLEAAAQAWPGRHEVICVDDGSRDATWTLLQQQAAAAPHWRCYSFSRNFGHQAAVSAGLQKARGDALVVIDADLQDPPEELIRFITAWLDDYDVVYGVRESRDDPALKQVLAWGFYRVMEKLATIHIPRDSGDFALFDRKVVDIISQLPERRRYLRGLRSWVGFRQKALVFKRVARVAGQPHYTFKSSLQLALDGVFSFSTVPLRLASCLGFMMSGIAVMMGILAILQRSLHAYLDSAGLSGLTVPPLVIALTLFGGVQLICLGILGEYLGRIYEEVKGRPSWIISGSTEGPQ